MSRLNDLLRQLRMGNPAMADDLQREFDVLADRRSFGLNFERHVPEAVELPSRTVRKGDKVRMLPPRGERRTAEHDRLWRVLGFTTEDGTRMGSLASLDDGEDEATVAVDDLVVVAEFRDPIYPGLVSTGRVERGGEKPVHAVINAENFHALQTLLFTHRGRVDCIYIDPPYNTRDNDWKYNNDYVEPGDSYAHSKWLAFMERRLKLAERLLNPARSVLIVTIDEKEVHRLGLLLEQSFPGARLQMVSITNNPKGTSRPKMFSRVDEFIYFVMIGDAVVPDVLDTASAGKPVRWRYLRREDDESVRGSRPRQFYPVFIDPDCRRIVDVGKPIAPEVPVESVRAPNGLVPVFPVREDGVEMEWGLTGPSLMKAAGMGFARATPGHEKQPFIISYLTAPNIRKVEAGDLAVSEVREDGSKVVVSPTGKSSRPKTVWQDSRHSAGDHGKKLLKKLIPGREFPFPKSLYAVEDTIRYFVGDNPDAVVLDFFSGSGTTAHAVMRLNHLDGGHRRSISVTNNEVNDKEKEFLQQGLRPGDPEWESQGIFERVTRPRISCAVNGQSADGTPIEGDYKAPDGFPMREGFAENVEFFTMTYEAPLRVASHREFTRVAPLLWLRAGSEGRRIDDISGGWDVADVYGVIADLDKAEDFLKALATADRVTTAFIVTDEDRLFESIVAELPDGVEPVRLYEAYLRNFEIEAGRSAR